MKRNTIDAMAQAEAEFLRTEFLAPALADQPITVRIAGVVVAFKCVGRDFSGWGVFRPCDWKTCKFVRPATLTERTNYLHLFRPTQATLWKPIDEHGTWVAAIVRNNCHDFVPVRLVSECQPLDTVTARGDALWYDDIDNRVPQSPAEYMRDALARKVAPNDLRLPPHTIPALEFVYTAIHTDELKKEEDARRRDPSYRAKTALERAGGIYVSSVVRGDTMTVEWLVNGERHRSTIDKRTLAVTSAGICLSGEDAVFDLNSLVSVVREGQTRRKIVRVGDNQGYADY